MLGLRFSLLSLHFCQESLLLFIRDIFISKGVWQNKPMYMQAFKGPQSHWGTHLEGSL